MRERRSVLRWGFCTRLGRLALAGAGIVLGAGGAAEVSATPLTPFRDEAQAQRHCPGDKVVWLDFRKGVYYRKGQKLYRQGFDGSFVCEAEARGSLYRRSPLGLR
jgi:hypothetical protein